MPRIREYTSQVTADSTLRTQASSADMGSAFGQGVEDIGRGLMYSQEKIKQDTERTNLADANAKVSAFQLEMANHLRESKLTAGEGAPGFFDTYTKKYDERAQQVLDSLGDEKSKQVARTHIDSFKTSMGTNAFDFELDSKSAFRVTKTVEAVGTDAKLVNQDDKLYEQTLRTRESAIDADTGLSATKKAELKTNAKRVLASSSVEGYFARDIHGAAAKLLPDQVTQAYTESTQQTATPTSSFDRAVQVVLKFEGGYADKDGASGAPVNFGINQKYNPDIDVKNLTKAQAIDLYKQRYWKAIAGDHMEPKLALVAFDTAVNMGPSVANRLVAASGGDPAKLLELRKAEYARIAQNPAQAKYLNGWIARVDKLGAAINEVPVTDAQGQPVPQLKIPKDASLMPPQGVDIPGWNDLSLDDQQKFMAKLVADFNSKVTVDRATLNDDRKNMTANFLAGNNYSGEAALQARYAQAYGPEVAKRMVAEDMNAKQLGVFSKSVRGKSDAEIASIMGAPPGDNATADDYATYGKKMSVVQADRKELQQNPVAYVANNSPAVKQAATLVEAARAEAAKRNTPDAIESVATATQKFISASLAEQKRLGVANPQILSEAEEKMLVSKIEEIAGSGRDVAQSIDALYRQYGSYGPTVAAQMSKKVGGLMNVLGSGIDPNAATLLVESNRNKEELKKTLGPEKIKDLDVAVQGVMRDYSASLAALPNSASVQSNYQEQIATLAMGRMSKLGESQAEAVKNAYQALVADQYNFQDGYRVPKAVDAGTIRREATRTLTTLGPNDVALLPGSLGNPADRMQAQLSSIRVHGRWVTTSQTGRDGKTEEGLTLMVPTPGGFAPVPDPSGKPLFRSFGEMLLQDQSRGLNTPQDALLKGDMRSYERLRAQEKADQRKREAQQAQDMGRDFRANKK